jgi:hypothetical protein
MMKAFLGFRQTVSDCSYQTGEENAWPAVYSRVSCLYIPIFSSFMKKCLTELLLLDSDHKI